MLLEFLVKVIDSCDNIFHVNKKDPEGSLDWFLENVMQGMKKVY